MSTLKQLALLTIIALHTFGVLYLLLVATPTAIANDASQVGILFGLLALGFTAIGTAILFTPSEEVAQPTEEEVETSAYHKQIEEEAAHFDREMERINDIFRRPLEQKERSLTPTQSFYHKTKW